MILVELFVWFYLTPLLIDTYILVLLRHYNISLLKQNNPSRILQQFNWKKASIMAIIPVLNLGALVYHFGLCNRVSNELRDKGGNNDL